jgi:hypothetical protein
MSEMVFLVAFETFGGTRAILLLANRNTPMFGFLNTLSFDMFMKFYTAL